jgi:hypothetical protein
MTEAAMSGKMMRIAAVLLATGVAQSFAACPFCPPSSPTLAEQLAESDIGVLVAWVRAVDPQDGQTEPRTDFRIVEVLRAPESGPKKDATVSVSFLRDGKPGDLFLLMGQQIDGITNWSLPVEVTEISAAYVRQAPSPERPATERLPFFLKFLESRDPLLANDAFAEFSRAKYEDVVALRKQLPREKIRQWIADPETPAMRLGFYGLLLGLSGTADDAEFLAGQVFRPTAENETRIGLDGLMAGYVLLTGEAGLQRLLQQKLHDPQQPDGDVFAVINLLRFLWQFAAERVPQAKVAAALRPLVDRPQFAEVAIVDLARWQDWTALPALIAKYGQPPFETTSAKMKVVQYALACRKHGGDDPAAATARQFLEDLRTKDPDTLRTAERFFGP